jgi:antitoxin ParD1/3/4
MSNVEKLSIALTREQAEDIREAVRAGEYASTSEVVRDAIRAWTNARDERAAAIAQVRKLWDDGLASGVAEHRRTPAEIKADGRRRMAEAAKRR